MAIRFELNRQREHDGSHSAKGKPMNQSQKDYICLTTVVSQSGGAKTKQH
jgi:hypothetical protein